MKEFKDIISAYQILKQNNTKCVLATVVHVEGSSYRRPKARMLVDENGNLIGAISGGCLEGDSLKKALHALFLQKNITVTYDTNDEEDKILGAQLGCNGIIQVLFEPIFFENNLNPIEIIKILVQKNEDAILVTLFNLEDKSAHQIGTSILFYHHNQIFGNSNIEILNKQIFAHAEQGLKNHTDFFIEYSLNESKYHAFLEYYNVPIKLIIIGAGNDVFPLIKFADVLGWDKMIIDGRPSYLNSTRFVGCQIKVSKPDEALVNMEIKERFAFLLLSHNYHYDFTILKYLLKLKIKNYIGILGPLKKYKRMLDDLNIEGIKINKLELSNIFSPVGLDISAEGPEEIALSIIAEIQMFIKGGSGDSLKYKLDPIHSREMTNFVKVNL